MKILFVSSEVVPFAKTGGLADVAGALPVALEQAGDEVSIVMPRYSTVRAAQHKLKKAADGISCARLGKNIRVFFIEHDGYFKRDGLYQDKKGDYPDNLERFSYFSRRALTLIRELELDIDIIHVNDWQTALIPVYLKTNFSGDALYKKIRTVLTLHNLGYQGLFPSESFPKLGLDRGLFGVDGLEFFGSVNLLKGGLMFADFLTTVSPTYSREIQTPHYGFGLQGVLAQRRGRLAGILNGLDYGIWDPATDEFIARKYGPASVRDKAANTAALRAKCNLRAGDGVPVVGIVSRLAQQKGFDILIEALPQIMKLDLQLVVLGAGDQKYVDALKEAQEEHPGRISINLGFDDPLAHLIYAGSDIFLMPSQYEPCGLGQMISLKYGTVPVVFKTGGLADTVNADNGFVFEDYSAGALSAAVKKALGVYRRKPEWARLAAGGMRCDFSWERAAREYRRLYAQIISE